MLGNQAGNQKNVFLPLNNFHTADSGLSICALACICIVCSLIIWVLRIKTKTRRATGLSYFWSKSCSRASERANKTHSQQTSELERLQERAVEQSVGKGSRADCIPCRISGARIASHHASCNFHPLDAGIPIPLGYWLGVFFKPMGFLMCHVSKKWMWEIEKYNINFKILKLRGRVELKIALWFVVLI